MEHVPISDERHPNYKKWIKKNAALAEGLCTVIEVKAMPC